MMQVASSYARAAVAGKSDSLRDLLTWPLLDNWIWAALTPVIFETTRRVPFSRRSIARPVLVHAALLLVCSVVHSAIVVAAGLGPNVAGFLRGVQLQFLTLLYLNFWMYWPLVGIWYLLDARRRYRDGAIRAAELESELSRAEMEALRNQLQPHFLFNTLNSISSLVQDDPEGAEDMLADLSYMLRTLLKSGEQQEIPLELEMQLVRSYLRIQKVRFGDALSVEIDTAQDTLQALVPSLVLQTLVENAIRHGISQSARPGRLRISSRRAAGRLLLEVSDDGPGVRTPSLKGIGLSNTRRRLERLYGSDGHLELVSAPGELTRARVTLPLRVCDVVSKANANEDSDIDRRRRTAGAGQN